MIDQSVVETDAREFAALQHSRIIRFKSLGVKQVVKHVISNLIAFQAHFGQFCV